MRGMRSAFITKTVVALASAVIVLGPAAATLAHETREVGTFELVVGWAEEPAFVGFLNAVQLRVSDGAGNPVEGADLQADVSLGEESTGPLALDPAFGSPGEYLADLIPTAPGAYTFRFTGTVDGQEVDQEFTASEDTFDEVHNPSEIQFPAEAPTNTELAERVQTVAARVDGLEMAASDADDSAAGARTFAIIALALGAIGAVLGAAAFFKK